MGEQKANWKVQEVEALSRLIDQCKVTTIASSYKVRAPQLQALRKKLRGEVTIKVSKNTLMQRAIEKCEKTKPNIKELPLHIAGASIFMFTNIDPFRLAILLEKSKIKTAAKAGDIAPDDIVIPAGNTGLPPGPVISELTEVGLPTKIEAGSVIITRDTVVAKRGDVISPKLASVLSKLGVKPIEVGLMLNAAYENGSILTSDALRIDLDALKKQIEDAHNYALNLALNSAFATKETAGVLLMKARMDGYAVALKAKVQVKDLVSDSISEAYRAMMAPTPPVEEKVEKVEGEEKKEKGETK